MGQHGFDEPFGRALRIRAGESFDRVDCDRDIGDGRVAGMGKAFGKIGCALVSG